MSRLVVPLLQLLIVVTAALPAAVAQTKDLPLPGEVFAIDGCTGFVLELQEPAAGTWP